MMLMIAGGTLIVLSTAGFITIQAVLGSKKKKIREETYQIYD